MFSTFVGCSLALLGYILNIAGQSSSTQHKSSAGEQGLFGARQAERPVLKVFSTCTLKPLVTAQQWDSSVVRNTHSAGSSCLQRFLEAGIQDSRDECNSSNGR